jgi:thiamine biosynthesis lipoprotein
MDVLISQGVVDRPLSKRAFRPSFNLIDLDLPGSRVRLPHHMEIDLGGIAKGWIVEKASNLLRSFAPICVVNAGGDICFTGTPGVGIKWHVELEDPRQPDQLIGELFVEQCAMATSSVTKRSWHQNGQIRHHLIDPRTGEPAVINWLSVTVVSPKITEAEVLAKAILIGGENETRHLALRFPNLAYICVDQSGQISGSEIGMELLNDYEYIYK